MNKYNMSDDDKRFLENRALAMKQGGYQNADIEEQLGHEFIFSNDIDGNCVKALLWK